jgi:Cys-rich repeat protein
MTVRYRVLLMAARAGLCSSIAALCCNLYEGRTLELFPELDGPIVECSAPGDCPHERQRCERGACVECVLDSDCGRGKPACAANVCVECRAAEHCASNQACNDQLSTCALRCAQPSDCAGQAASRCSSELGLCVQCLSDPDCSEPRAPACDRGGRCVECLDDRNCPPDRPSCQLGTRACVECTDSSDCAGRVCDPRDSRCVDCLSDADCDAGTCDVDRRCHLPCTAPSDCDGKKPLCDLATGLCTECDTNEACRDPIRPACSPERQCVECMADADCTTPGKRACITARQRCGECTRDEHCPETMHCDLPAARCAPSPPAPPVANPGPGPPPAPAPAP